jgi:hypothetical protein
MYLDNDRRSQYDQILLSNRHLYALANQRAVEMGYRFVRNVLALLILGVAMSPAAASAHGPFGFTGDVNFCHAFLERGQICLGGMHSWGFLSNEHADPHGYPLLEAEARGWYSGDLYFESAGYGFTRACWNWHSPGGWPHCTDQDAYDLRPFLHNRPENDGGHWIQGHGLY